MLKDLRTLLSSNVTIVNVKSTLSECTEPIYSLHSIPTHTKNLQNGYLSIYWTIWSRQTNIQKKKMMQTNDQSCAYWCRKTPYTNVVLCMCWSCKDESYCSTTFMVHGFLRSLSTTHVDESIFALLSMPSKKCQGVPMYKAWHMM